MRSSTSSAAKASYWSAIGGRLIWHPSFRKALTNSPNSRLDSGNCVVSHDSVATPCDRTDNEERRRLRYGKGPESRDIGPQQLLVRTGCVHDNQARRIEL